MAVTTTSLRPPSGDTLSRFAPTFLFALTTAATAGGALAKSAETAAETERLRVRLESHLASDTTAVVTERVHALETRQVAIDEEVRALRDTLDRIDRNLVAVCSQTPRAQCVR